MIRGEQAGLRFLEDRAAIQDLLTHYFTAVDRRDWEGVAACFTADAALEYHYFRGDVSTVIAAIRDGLVRFETTTHLMGNLLIELDGDAATSETYAVTYHRRADVDRVVGVRYVDALVRRGPRWLITRRELQIAFDGLHPIVRA